jgi:toxin ParE1/3/4
MKPIVRHARADQDVQEALAYYIEQSPIVAMDWVDALEFTYQQIQQLPAAGSARYGHELNLPGLRFQRCGKFPYLVFYVELASSIAIWRVLHEKRDIPAWLQD